MTRTTINLGGTASNVVVGKVAHGLMSMTWKEVPESDDQCFEAIKAGIDALPPNAKMFLNGGVFYGHNGSTTNLEMISRFFEKYPEYTDRAFVSIKGGSKPGTLEPDCSPENLVREINMINKIFRGTKRLDLFQCARIDPNVPVETSIATLAKLKEEGKLDHIGMSECSAQTLRRGNEVHPISVVEIEVSPFSYEDKAREVISVAKELGISVAAYSPLGRGFLTGQIKRLEDLPEGDFRRHLPRFQEENLEHNFAIVDALTEIANKKNVSSAQLCIAWVGSLGKHVIPLPGSSRAKRTLENCGGGDVVLTEDELQQINELIEKADVRGTRYPEAHKKYEWA